MPVFCLTPGLRPIPLPLVSGSIPRDLNQPGLGMPAPSPVCLAGHAGISSPNPPLSNRAPFPQLQIHGGQYPQAPAPLRELEAAALHWHQLEHGMSPVPPDPQPTPMTLVFSTVSSVAAHSATVARPRRCILSLPTRILGRLLAYRLLRAVH